MIYSDTSAVRVIRLDLLRQFDVRTASFLSQLDFLLDHSVNVRDGHFWIYRTYEEWAQDIQQSKSTVRRIVKRLCMQGVLICGRYNRYRYDRTTWFRLDYDVLTRLGIACRHCCTGEKAIAAGRRAEEAGAFDQPAPSLPVESAPDGSLDTARPSDPSDGPCADGFDLNHSMARYLAPELQAKVLHHHQTKGDKE